MKSLNDLSLSPLVAVTDIETLAKTPDAVIGSIGCVVVNVLEGVEVARFYSRCHIDSQTDRRADLGTLAWWEKQQQESPEAWAEIFNPPGRCARLSLALERLATFLDEHFPDGVKKQVMGNGPEFDNVILGNAYEQAGLAIPWHFAGNQSLRTAVWLGRVFLGIDPKYDLQFEGARHHALYDAVHEAKYLLAITKAFSAECLK